MLMSHCNKHLPEPRMERPQRRHRDRVADFDTPLPIDGLPSGEAQDTVLDREVRAGQVRASNYLGLGKRKFRLLDGGMYDHAEAPKVTPSRSLLDGRPLVGGINLVRFATDCNGLAAKRTDLQLSTDTPTYSCARAA